VPVLVVLVVLTVPTVPTVLGVLVVRGTGCGVVHIRVGHRHSRNSQEIIPLTGCYKYRWPAILAGSSRGRLMAHAAPLRMAARGGSARPEGYRFG
jgi:hypothetical protein